MQVWCSHLTSYQWQIGASRDQFFPTVHSASSLGTTGVQAILCVHIAMPSFHSINEFLESEFSVRD